MEEYVWVSKLIDHPVFVSRAHPILRRLAADHNVKLTIAGPADNSTEPYVEAVRSAAARRAAGIMVVGFGDEEIAAAIDDAVESGIPVVTVDSDVPSSRRLAHVGTDWHRMGAAMARRLADLVGARGKVLILGMTALPTMRAGFRGFKDRIERFEHIEVLGPLDDMDVGPDRAERIAAEHIRRYPDLRGIAGFDGNSGPGAAAAVEKAGRADEISVVCVDAEELQLDYLRKGVIDAAFSQRREAFTYHAFQLLYAFNHGSSLSGMIPGMDNIPGNIDTGFVVVTRENADRLEAELGLGETLERGDLSRRLRRAEAALENKSELLRAALDSTGDGVLVVGSDGRVMLWNRRFAEMWRVPDSVVASGRSDAIMEAVKDQLADPDGFVERVRQLYTGATECLDTLHFKDGRVFERFSCPLMQEGRIAGRVWSFRDATEQKRASEILRQRQQFLRDVFGSIQDGISILDKNLRIISVNKTMERWYAHAMPLVGKQCYEAYHGRTTACKTCPTIPVLATREAAYNVVPRVGPDGSITGWLDLYSFPLIDTETGELNGVIEYVRDITERKLAEEALKASEANYRAIFDAAYDAIFIHHPETGAILDVNRKMCEMFGFTRDEAVALSVNDISLGAPPYSEAEAMKWIESAAAGQQVNFEWRCKDKAGRLFWVEVNLKNASLSGENRILAVVRDMSERKRLEEQLLQSQKMEAVGRLAGGVAHDFNNLLTAIIGYSNVAMDEMDPADPYRQNVMLINQAAKKAADLTKQLLAFSRKQVLAVRLLDLNQVIQDTELMLRRLIGVDIELRSRYEPSLWKVAADRSQVEQIVLNLAVNARDAMPQGGTLSIETSNVTLDEAAVKTQPGVSPGDYVLISVSDTGAGMDAETRSHIFEPFFTTKEKTKGTGLGLSTVYGIVTQHRGHITVYSEPGRGTIMKVFLPRAEKGAAAETRAERPQSRLVGDETILIAEDEDLVRKVAGRILEMHGYTVLSAPGPHEAIELFEKHSGPIHLLLSDVVMPQMDGRKLYEELSKRAKELKVLFMSGYAEESVTGRGALDLEVHFLQKPFTVDALTVKVRQVLDAPADGARTGGP